MLFWVTVILILQTAFSLSLIFLRTHSVRRTLAKPRKGYESKLLQWLKKPNLVFSFCFWEAGAVRAQLISHWASNLVSYTNFRGADGFETLREDPDEIKAVVEKLDSFGDEASLKNSGDHHNKKTLYGFFHPYCNAFGGGEKVLWKAVETTLNHDLDNVAIIYTGDIEASPEQILNSVSLKFDYKLDTSRIVFIYLKKRWLVDSNTWKHFTLVGQAFGSIVLTIEAILKCPPDIWCDTMGYPFGYPWVAHILRIPVVTYTHFPVISTDMLDKLKANLTLKNRLKYYYWKMFMCYYQHVGSYVTIATTNSTWTNNHISKIWTKVDSSIIYPPCSTEKLVDRSKSIDNRANIGVVLAQFRPEKRHDLMIKSYAEYLKNRDQSNVDKLLTLKFIGSTRSQADKDYVSELKQQVKSLNIPDNHIDFITDCSYAEVKEHLFDSTYGINGMWNEHFGIAVVEYIAAGLVALVHASAGPYLDIVDKDIGYFFVDPSDPDYSKERGEEFPTLDKLFMLTETLDTTSKLAKSKLGEKKALDKFSDEKFDVAWTNIVLHALEKKNQ